MQFPLCGLVGGATAHRILLRKLAPAEVAAYGTKGGR
jgi:hypothetical protein